MIKNMEKYLAKETGKKVWNEIEPEIYQRGYEIINKVMFGNQNIPFASGCTIGFNIVKSFKQNNPEYSGREIIDLNPKKIFEKSTYK